MSRQRTNPALPLGALAAGFGLSLMGSTALAQTAADTAKQSDQALPEVTVQGTVDRTPPAKNTYQATTTTIGKGKQELRDIPQSVTVVTEKLMKDRPLTDIKADTYGFNRALIKILVGVAALLVLVTSIGIVGLTAFSVTERTRQIGTRRALGATRGAVLRYFLVENGMVTGVGLTLGTAAAVAMVVTASEYREAAFTAAEFLMDYRKTNAPFWKREESARGTSWIEAKSQDDAAAARWTKS